MNDFIGYNPANYMNPYPNIYPTVTRPVAPTGGVQAQSIQLIKVNGIESARAYPTQPNSMVALFDENDDIFYIKQTDASNFPTIRRFRFVEESEEQAKNDKYVTIDEFNKFKEEMLNGQQSVRSGKSNGGSRNNKQYTANQKHDADASE